MRKGLNGAPFFEVFPEGVELVLEGDDALVARGDDHEDPDKEGKQNQQQEFHLHKIVFFTFMVQ